jgi:hypothetical protein
MLLVALAVAATAIGVAGFEVGVRLIPPDAAQVSVTAAADGHVLATREVRGAGAVADLYARINGLPSADPFPVYHCALAGPDAVTFGIRFTRWGLPVEVAVLRGNGCRAWRLSRGGIPDTRNDPQGQTRAIISEIQPLSCPPAWLPACGGG